MELGLRTGVLVLMIDLAGALMAAFLLSLVLRKRPAAAADWITALAFAAIAFWYAADAVSLFRFASVASAGLELEGSAARIAGIIAGGCVLHLSLIWAGLRPVWGVAVFVAAAGVLVSRSPVVTAVWTVLTAGGAAILNVAVTSWHAAPYNAAFHRALAAALALILPAAAFGNPVLLECALLLPLVCVLWFVRHSGALDLVPERRLKFVFAMAGASAAYLFFVRFIVGEYLATEFGAFGAVVEFAMICAAGVFWLPLYEAMTRFLSRRALTYLDAAKHIIDSADEILDTTARVQFLAEQTAVRLKMRRVSIALTDRPDSAAGSSDSQGIDLGAAHVLANAAAATTAEYLHFRRTADEAVREALTRTRSTYAFPLRFKDQITGLLLVDSSPRAILDEETAVLVALSRDIAHSVASCRMVEEQMRLNRTLLQQEHLAALGKVAATVAHEVRNPLSSIKALAQLMSEDAEFRSKYERDLGFIVSEADRLASSVGQLLAYSRPAAQPRPDASIHELLDSTVAALERSQGAAGVSLRKEIDPALRGCLVDREAVQHIVFNLMLNALQACSPGGSVELAARLTDSGRCVIEVKDDGPGIPADTRAHIFEPFFTTRKHGSGLGLAVVRKTVGNMNGSIDIISPVAEGHGTVFRVEIPTVRAFGAPA